MAGKNLLIATIIILTALAPFLAGASNAEIQSIGLTPEKLVKSSSLNVDVVIKNSGTSVINGGKVKLKVEGPGITTMQIEKSATLQLGETTVPFASFISNWAGFQESQVYTVTAELYDSFKLLDRKQETFIIGRTAAAVPEANPLLAALILGIVLGIFAFKKK